MTGPERSPMNSPDADTADRPSSSAYPPVGLDGEPCRSRSDNCPHTMVARCPGCRMEMYAPGVWDFSHGEVACQCGYVVTPRQRRVQEAPEWTI